MEILTHIEEVAKKFSSIEQKKPILIYSHYDADGITSAAILAKTLNHLDKKFQLKIVKNLDEKIINNIKLNSHLFSSILFLDLGSNFLSFFSDFKCPVFIIDHHNLVGEYDRSKIINYRTFGDDYETSSSVLSYFFCNYLISRKQTNSKIILELQKIALLGLIGDALDNNLSKLSSFFIKLAKESGAIIVKKGLQVFSYTRPIHKSLEYSNIYIPGITGNEDNVIKFLQDLNIEIRNNGTYKTLLDLNEEETSRLITSIATLRITNNENTDIIGNVYIINLFDTIQDAREISTLINACGRLDRHEIAISFLLGDKSSMDLAVELYTKYKYDIIRALKIFEEEMKNKKDGNYVIINVKDRINPNIVGTVCSMLLKSQNKDNFIIAGLAYREDGIKVSLRSNRLDVTRILSMVKEKGKLDFEYGGHKYAAGALVDYIIEEKFISTLKKVLREESLTIKI